MYTEKSYKLIIIFVEIMLWTIFQMYFISVWLFCGSMAKMYISNHHILQQPIVCAWCVSKKNRTSPQSISCYITT